MVNSSPLAKLPSVDKLLSDGACANLLALYGRPRTTAAIRSVLASVREEILQADGDVPATPKILDRVGRTLESTAADSSLKPVLNLTGTVLHTNLGRASLPAEAVDAMTRAATHPVGLEYDLVTGHRGNRDTHIENLLTSLTGAEAATVVNNNAAAVMLTLNTLALDKEVPVSRGELVEIGGSFRIPDIMQRSGCVLVEVGTTNRTHPHDYAGAINANTAALMKVHTSNYAIRGFAESVSEEEAARLAHDKDLPLVTDLGSGTLVDLVDFGLPREPTVAGAISAGADIVTFSGDKLLGGPQAGLIVGRKRYVDAINANPMKRALRVDKITLAALCAVLELYRDPDTLARRLPTLRLLTRSREDIERTAEAVLPAMAAGLEGVASVEVRETRSQIGSGSLPLNLLPSVAIAIKPVPGPGDDSRLQRIAAAFRRLDVPVIGRIHDGVLLFDLRTLENPSELTEQLPRLELEAPGR